MKKSRGNQDSFQEAGLSSEVARGFLPFLSLASVPIFHKE